MTTTKLMLMLATPKNMKAMAVMPGREKTAFAYSPTTGERYSANPHDYWNLHDDHALLDGNGEAMVLAVETHEVEVLTESVVTETTTGLTDDVPFEPQFGDMSRDELLVIARRYHWMLAEVEAFSPDSDTSVTGQHLYVDMVVRNDDQTYITMYGTAEDDDAKLTPHIIGEV
jgi:hypothetical protein